MEQQTASINSNPAEPKIRNTEVNSQSIKTEVSAPPEDESNKIEDKNTSDNNDNKDNQIKNDDSSKLVDENDPPISPTSTTSNGKIVFRNTGPSGLVSVLNVPVCRNCMTSTTPLWRRDENGAVLCNACGLFLKLHGRPRPISLKTNVIKPRNRKNNSNSENNGAEFHKIKKDSGSSHDKKRKSGSLIGSFHLNNYDDGHKRVKSLSPHIPESNTLQKGEQILNVSDSQIVTSNNSNNIINNNVKNSNIPQNQPPVSYNIPNTAMLDNARARNNSTPNPGIVNVSSQLPGLSSLLTNIDPNGRPVENSNNNTNNSNSNDPNHVNTSGMPQPISPPPGMNNGLQTIPGSFLPNDHIPVVMKQQQQQPMTSVNNVQQFSTRSSSAMTSPLQNAQRMPSNVPIDPLHKDPQFGPVMSNQINNNVIYNNQLPGSSESSENRSDQFFQMGSPPQLPQQHSSTIQSISQALLSPVQPENNASGNLRKNNSSDKTSKQNSRRKLSVDTTENMIKEYSFEDRLRHEEEIIRLKAKITELESVTDLYRNHIFKLNQKCQKYEQQLSKQDN